jgi:hypothetical protein
VKEHCWHAQNKHNFVLIIITQGKYCFF